MLLSKLGSFSHIAPSMDLPAKLQLHQGNGSKRAGVTPYSVTRCIL